MAFNASPIFPGRPGQESPCRHVPSSLSEDERWVLQESGWAKFHWDVEPEDEKAISEGRLPDDAFIPPTLLVESAPLVEENVSTDSLFGDEETGEEIAFDKLSEFEEHETGPFPSNEEVFSILAHFVPTSSTPIQPTVPKPSSSPAPTRISTPTPPSLLSFPPPLFAQDTRPTSPSPSSISKAPSFVTPALSRRTRNSRSPTATPALSASCSSASSNADSEPNFELDTPFHNAKATPAFMQNQYPMPIAPCEIPVDSQFTPYSAILSHSQSHSLQQIELGNTNDYGFSSQVSTSFSKAGPSTLTPARLSLSCAPSFADFELDPSGSLLDLGLDAFPISTPIKRPGNFGPIRSYASSSGLASTAPYFKGDEFGFSPGPSRPRKRVRPHREISGKDVIKREHGSQMKCPQCKYVQKRGAGDIRSFKRHVETHPENKSVEWRCRGLFGSSLLSWLLDLR